MKEFEVTLSVELPDVVDSKSLEKYLFEELAGIHVNGICDSLSRKCIEESLVHSETLEIKNH